MPFNATVSAGWTYKTGDTVTAANLNALGVPTVSVPDDKTYLINVGSVSAPGIAFFGDANTGLAQLAGGDTASVVIGGAETVRFIAGQTGFVNGTDSAPAITFVGDGDTGINHDTADQIDFVCNKTVVGQFNTSGLIVVGNIEADSMTVNGANVLTAGINTSQFVYWTDFTGPLASTAFTTTTVATGAVVQIASTGRDPNWRGLAGLTVTAVSDRAVLSIPMGIASGGFFRVRMALGATTAGSLSTPTERYYTMIGVTNNITDTLSSAAGNGCWFQYTDSASAQWQTVTMSGGTKETQTTDVTVAASDTYYTLEMRRASASNYQFYINGVLKATHTTSVHSGIDMNYFVVILEKTVGSTIRGIQIDSIEIVNPLTRT